MHVSLTPELEKIVKEKVATGLYNNASEVIREALRFIQTNEELIQHMKLETLRRTLAEGERDIEAGHYRVIAQDEFGPFMQDVRDRVLARNCRPPTVALLQQRPPAIGPEG